MAVPVIPPRGPQSPARLSGTQRLTALAWLQLALTVCGVAFGIAVTRVLLEGGNTMACFDGNESACSADPIGLGDQWRSLTAGATLIALSAVAVLVAHLHSRRHASRAASIGALSLSVALNALAAVALLSL